jgi:DNA-binding response OmpR family regulator
MALSCLIAAHDPWFIQLLRAYAQETGFQITQVYQSHEVLPAILQNHPTAIFLQSDLPGNYGCSEIIRSIKATPEVSDSIILVFYTQLVLVESDLVGCDAIHLREPVSFIEFQEALIKAGVIHSPPSHANSGIVGLTANKKNIKH